jgi:ABC-type sugar transport system ATPase subunit
VAFFGVRTAGLSDTSAEMSPPSPPAVLRVERLAKSFGGLQAVDGVSFHVAPGEIVGLVGPNGAGKSTTLNVISGLLRPDAGEMEFLGRSIIGQAPEAIPHLTIAANGAPGGCATRQAPGPEDAS